MNNKNMILLGALLACAIDGMAQTSNTAQGTDSKPQNDSIWKDIDLASASSATL